MALEPKVNADGIGFIGAESVFEPNVSAVFEAGTKHMADTTGAAIRSSRWFRGTLTDLDNLDAVATTGAFHIPSSATALALGLPSPSMGFLDSLYTNTSYARQIWHPDGHRVHHERILNAGAWGAWHKRPTGESPGIANRLLVEDFTRRRGTAKTNGRGAVALRFDHGLANFRDIILPLLQGRGLTASLALNSRNWDLAENGGVTAADVNTWVTDGVVEVWNHGAHHTNAVSTVELEDTIIGGLTELRQQIPAATIDGFVVPGVGAGGYGGFDGGQSASAFYGTEAGRIILTSHAVSTGYYPNTAHRVLDGTVRQGQSHYTMDSITLSATVKAQIDQAIRDSTGLQLMLHPSQLNGTDKMTTATLTAVLDYIAQKRDADEIVATSPYELMVTNARTPAIIPDPDVPGAYLIE